MHCLQQNAVSNPGATFEVCTRSLETSLWRAQRLITKTLVTKSTQKPKLLMCKKHTRAMLLIVMRPLTAQRMFTLLHFSRWTGSAFRVFANDPWITWTTVSCAWATRVQESLWNRFLQSSTNVSHWKAQSMLNFCHESCAMPMVNIYFPIGLRRFNSLSLLFLILGLQTSCSFKALVCSPLK